MKGKLAALTLILLAGCAHKVPTVSFLYKGMNKDLMLNVMGEPVQILSTYQGNEEAKLYQFSNSRCQGGTKNVCSVSLTKDGIVYGWKDVKVGYTEDGQR